jgi:mRNA interferase MazF
VGFERYAVVRVPFPFTDRNASKNRPALVLSDDAAFNTPAPTPFNGVDAYLGVFTR